jgi:hypothetical protein
MRKIQVKIIGSGTESDPYRVDLPTWQGIEFDTDKGKKPPNAFAIVEVPDDEVDEKGKIDRKRLKEKYKGSVWEKHKPDIGDEEAGLIG